MSETFLVLDIGTFSVKALNVEKRGSNLKIKAWANEVYKGDLYTDKGFDIKVAIDSCRRALNKLKESSGGSFHRKAILGIGGGFIYGKTLTQNHIRENPEEEISSGEFANIIQKIQQRVYEQIRRDFAKDTARSELEVYLINALLQEVKIDGYQVVNPVGFKGKEISISLFNSYAPRSCVDIFEKLASELRLEIISVISEPRVVFDHILQGNPARHDAVLVDIGGSITEISLIRKGKIEDIKSIAVGGSSFTKSIAGVLKITFSEAENIKKKFSDEAMSGYASKKIEKIVARDIKFFLDSLSMVLSDLSQVVLLPSRIYIYGGGARMPLVEKMLKQKAWRDKLSFFSIPQILTLFVSLEERSDFPILFPNYLKNTLWTTPIALAKFYANDNKKENDVEKIMKRSLRLIQG